MDIDGDGTYDFKFLFDGDTLINELNYPIAQFICQHDGCSVFGYYENDTVFSYKETSGEYSSYAYTCTPWNFYEDSVEFLGIDVYLNQPKLKALNSNDLLARTGNFISEPITKIGQSTNIYYGRTQQVWKDFSCDDLQINKTHYIGIQLTNDQTIKLGWIKVTLLAKNKLIIFESGIQE